VGDLSGVLARVLWAVLTMSNVRFDGQNILMGVLALAAGILLVLER